MPCALVMFSVTGGMLSIAETSAASSNRPEVTSAIIVLRAATNLVGCGFRDALFIFRLALDELNDAREISLPIT